MNVLAFVAGMEEFQSLVSAALEEVGLQAFEFEEVEKFAERARKSLLSEDLHSLAAAAESTGRVQFDTFYAFPSFD